MTSQLTKQWEMFLKEKRMNEQFICSTIGKEYDIYCMFREFPDIIENEIAIEAVDEDFTEEVIDNADTKLHISTTTKIAHLVLADDMTMPDADKGASIIDIYKLFWDLELVPFNEMSEGIIKKQIKYDVYNIEDMQDLDARCAAYNARGENVIEHVIKHVVHVQKPQNKKGRPSKRPIVADAESATVDEHNITDKSITHTRKISVGTCKKEILNSLKKKKTQESKAAFSNCIALYIRYNDDTETAPTQPLDYHEYHVKIFKTGKIEIPGIKNADPAMFNNLLTILTQKVSDTLGIRYRHVLNEREMVLINSTFYCGFNINRDALSSILSKKYGLNCIFDSHNYPGILCDFYYNIDLPYEEQTGRCPPDHMKNANKKNTQRNIVETTYMIFRTGKILILGKCTEKIIRELYTFIKHILEIEKDNIIVHSHV